MSITVCVLVTYGKNSIVLMVHLVKTTPVSNKSCFLSFVAVFVSVVFVVVVVVVYLFPISM